jgi:hypothetical protein
LAAYLKARVTYAQSLAVPLCDQTGAVGVVVLGTDLSAIPIASPDVASFVVVSSVNVCAVLSDNVLAPDTMAIEITTACVALVFGIVGANVAVAPVEYPQTDELVALPLHFVAVADPVVVPANGL